MKASAFFLTLLFALTLSSSIFAQSAATLRLSGKVEKPLSLSVADLQQMVAHSIEPVRITSHKGEFKKETPNMKGILMTEVIAQAGIQAENPKVLSEYYLTARAADGYQVVFSWNELFNTEVGKSVYVVYEQGGESLSDYDGPIMLISPHDIQTGRRNVRQLSEIKVERIGKSLNP
ncbi:molybdopterin-dependent oxidoreductase [Catalinimonas sp. 4WD22]|uniref:molybdopterin-dependent oxidoreductase n=1 Tax=Catalinimonas locisalis TaxID=3133978 RepID=UPI003100FE47